MREYPISEQQSKEMYIEYSSYVYGIALMMTKSKMLADDITQETFLRAFQKFHLYDPSKPLRPWLFRMTINLIRSTQRKQRWLTFFGKVPDDAMSDSLEDLILKNEREQELWQVVNNLLKKRKDVIILHYYAGLTLQEVASILGIRLGTCKSRLHAALKQLRENNEDNYLLIPIKENMK
ncbi:RNA polymerase sigma factor [Paenibacillus sp. V4I7]|uniref:RNA polymerase sigma factor n=1 Tax=Paenibacillus sp. V4I7 TaxID=3042307 RepID=UPI0027848CF3|nr:sigma-70 family RNA polymerase sigma factor [Paenibacillus sp. V4I7]MDQ0899903.1 RNA polymerase sigma factor (sigma-70 family) [Paenibacillus sp. V4I7]